MPLPHQLSLRRWAALSTAALLGLACVALLLAGSRASAAPPAVPAPPPLSLPGPARLAPAAQLTPTICPLDVALVFDNSGSMEGDTICYDCWHKTTNDVTTYPYPANGTFYPISYSAVISWNLCGATSTPYVVGSYHYIIMEAELYARNSSDWHRAVRQPATGYWALQRGLPADDHNGDDRSSSVDGDFAAGGSRSAHVAHNPYWTFSQLSPPAAQMGRFYSLQDAIDGIAPRLEYDFTPTWSTPTYIWVRVQGGGQYSFDNDYTNPFTHNANKLNWAVDSGIPVQDASAPTCSNAVYDYAGCYLSFAIHDDQNCAPSGENCPNVWAWRRLGSVTVTAGTLHTLKLWAGSSGYEVDKIVITNDSNASLGTSTTNDVLTVNHGRGRPATVGSVRDAACDPCNPIYGLTVGPSDCTTSYYPVLTTTNRLQDELFGDREPLRTSVEMVKRSLARMDPRYDQVGFVGFHGIVSSQDQSELACLRRQAILGDPAACYTGGPAISYTNIMQTIERQVAQDGSNIAEGMRNGLEVLGHNVDNRTGVDNLCDGSANSACGRGYAARPMMILMTDGSPNIHTGDFCHSDPNLWPYNSDQSFDCVMYYAHQARRAGVPIYAIGLGQGVMPELLQAVADETGGEYYFASSPRDLDTIFDGILASTLATCTPYRLSMAADSAQAGLPGQRLVYTHVLTNLSYYLVTASLTYSADTPGWPASVSPVTQPLEPGQAVTVTAVVSVPPDSLEGDTNVLRLVAALQGGEAISATVADTTTTGLQRGVDVEPSLAASGPPGHAVTYTHVVTNTGNGRAAEVFTISAASGLWTPTWQPPAMSLAAGAAAPLTVTLLIPAGTLTGTFDVLTVTVISQADPDGVCDAVTDTTTVGWSPGVYLPIVLKGGRVWTQK